jgi:hypothetical protein
MFRLLILLAFVSLGAVSANAYSEIQGLVRYDCTQDCTLQCWGTGVNIQLKYRTLTVFQWKDHVRRLWIGLADAQYVLGDDTTCRFEGKPTFQFETSQFGPQPNPQCICFGNVCNPPGCGP